jgi:hypothetical protein
VIRVEPTEIAGVRDRYILEQIEGFDPSMLARVVSRREAGG